MSFKTYKWSFIERITVQLFQLVIIVITSRYVSPEQFGVFGLSAVVISISQVFVDSGFSAALIRKASHSQGELSSVFYINVLIAVICISLIYVFSPYVESYLGVDGVSYLARIASIVVMINALAVVPKVILTINLDFKSQANASILAVTCSGFISVYFAVKGYGALALVIQFISFNLINAVMLTFKSKWLPNLAFDFLAVKELSNFSLKLLFSGLIDALYQNLYVVFIGSMMSVQDVGIFSQGKRLSDIPALTIANSIQRANLAAMGRLTDDSFLREYTTKSLRLGMFVMAPAMFFLGCIATPLINLVMGEIWLDSAIIMTILSLSGIFYPLHVLNQNILIIKGRSGLHLKLEIIKKILGVVLILCAITHGLIWLCIGIFGHALLSVFINAYYTHSLIGLSLTSQMRLCLSPVFIAIFGVVLALVLRSLPLHLGDAKYDDIKDIMFSLFSFGFVFITMIPLLHRNELNIVLKNLKDKG